MTTKKLTGGISAKGGGRMIAALLMLAWAGATAQASTDASTEIAPGTSTLPTNATANSKTAHVRKASQQIARARRADHPVAEAARRLDGNNNPRILEERGEGRLRTPYQQLVFEVI